MLDIVYFYENNLFGIELYEGWNGSLKIEQKIFNVTHKIPNKYSMSGSNGIKLMNINYVYREFVIFCIKYLVNRLF